jgi:hypothetical protein
MKRRVEEYKKNNVINHVINNVINNVINLFDKKRFRFSDKQSEFCILHIKMRNKPEIKLDYDHHRDQEVILIKFDYNTRKKK